MFYELYIRRTLITRYCGDIFICFNADLLPPPACTLEISLIRRTTLLLLWMSQLAKHPCNIHAPPPPPPMVTVHGQCFLTSVHFYHFMACIGACWVTVTKGNAELSNFSWWRHQVETFSALLDICAGYSPVTGEFPQQRPVMFWCYIWSAFEQTV